MSDPTRAQPFSTISEDHTIRTILEGTASATGDAFFHALVQNQAKALHVRQSWITEFVAGNTRIRVLAFWNGNELREGFEYDLAGTPCERVISGEFVHHAHGVQALYPGDPLLAELDAESYVGVPLRRDGQVLGHLAVMDDRPIETRPRGLSVFHIFAARAAAELWRLRIENRVRGLEQRVSGIVESAMDAIVALDESLEIERFNPAAEAMFERSAETAKGSSFEALLGVEGRAIVAKHLRAMRDSATPALPLPTGLVMQRSSGESFPAEGSASFIDVQGHPLFTLFLRDVSQRMEAGREIERLSQTARYLQEEIEDHLRIGEVIGVSPAMQTVHKSVERVAPTDATVLITGETGSGKERISRALHAQSPRADRPFVKVNCGTLPAGLVESELFGHEKGAFTGAAGRRIGRFELADGGTLFLDEVGDLPLDAQVKLLRVLQEGEFERVGGSGVVRVDVRILAATHRDLLDEVSAGRFREDLFYRLNVFPIHVPPLRERVEDIPRFVHYFVAKYAQRFSRTITNVADESMEQLSTYRWPGNVRELENVIERALILTDGPILWLPTGTLADADSPNRSHDATTDAVAGAEETLEQVERQHISHVLAQNRWVIDGDQGAARVLGLHPSTLRNRMRKLRIERPD